MVANMLTLPLQQPHTDHRVSRRSHGRRQAGCRIWTRRLRLDGLGIWLHCRFLRRLQGAGMHLHPDRWHLEGSSFVDLANVRRPRDITADLPDNGGKLDAKQVVVISQRAQRDMGSHQVNQNAENRTELLLRPRIMVCLRCSGTMSRCSRTAYSIIKASRPLFWDKGGELCME